MSDDIEELSPEDFAPEPNARPPGRRGTRINWLAVVVTFASLGTGIVAAAFGGLMYKRLGVAQTDLARVEAELAAERKKNAELSAGNAKLEGDLRTNEAARATSEKEVAEHKTKETATSAELEELRKQHAELEARLAAWKAITAKLQKMVDAGRLQVAVRDGKMVLKLSSEVLFQSGKADLANDGKTALREIAGILKQFPDRRLMVAGHTDNVPLHNAHYRSNWELSTARAVTVTEFLIASGVRPERLVAAGHAQFDPVGSNGNEAGRKENRRIELVLLPNVTELPALPAEPPPVAKP
jgi:chemotaxis protein MotB